MRVKLTNRHARLEMNSRPEVKACKSLEASFLRELIVAVHVDDMATVRVERTRFELIAKQSERTTRKVKQRADARVGLTIVISEVALEVAGNFRNPPVAEQLPVIREPLVQLDLHGLVLVNWIREAIRNSVRSEVSGDTTILAFGVITDRVRQDVAIAVLNVASHKVGVANRGDGPAIGENV